MGIVAIDDAVLITAASPAAARQLDCALRALAPDEVTDVSALGALLPIAEVLGPACLSYLAQEDLPMRHGDQAVERLPSGHRDLARLRGAASQDEVDESGLAEITSDAFVVRQASEVISAAGFRRWPCDVAHMSLLTAAPARVKDWRSDGQRRRGGGARSRPAAPVEGTTSLLTPGVGAPWLPGTGKAAQRQAR